MRATDRVFGDLGDDKVLGGPGDRDEVGGGLGIDTVNGGPGNEDLVHGDYGYDRMDGGPGEGDIASFATAVAGGKGAAASGSRSPRTRRCGDGHDRLFRFEAIEGSAFDDTLIGDTGRQRDRRRPRQRPIIGGGGRDTLDGGQGNDRCKGGPTRISCGPEKPAQRLRLRPARSRPGGGGGLQIVGGSGPDNFTVAYDEASTEPSSVTARDKGTRGGRRLRPPRPGDPKQVICADERPGALADGRPRARQRQLARRRLACARSTSSASPAATATTRSTAAPRTT